VNEPRASLVQIKRERERERERERGEGGIERRGRKWESSQEI